jgi:peroxiredoxin Q/BCP
MTVTLNQPVPDFSAAATRGKTFTLSELKGKNVILYFYPKDSTPGCTTEAMNFRDYHADFLATGTEIFGVSRDGIKSHENFKAKLELPFDLISDGDETLCNLFDVIRMKKMYGKEVRGIERSTFLIDQKGILRHEWRGVRVPNHVEDVLRTVRQQ